MNLPLFIARRYFFSRKIPNVIHIIAGISLAGITVGTFALIVILSTFNGFEEVVGKLYNTFESDLKISSVDGSKYFVPDSAKVRQVRNLPMVAAITPVLEENVILKYREKQAIATFKAVEPAYLHSTGIDSMIFLGDASLEENGYSFALVGAGVGSKLDLKGFDDDHPLSIYMPKQGEAVVLNPERAFNRCTIITGGIFSIQEDFDNRYVLLPIDFARRNAEQPVNVTSLEVNLKKGADLDKAKEMIAGIMGSSLAVKDRFQQQPMMYKVMRTEKMATYLVLSFILLIAAFNLVGALLMLAIEKQKDMAILLSLGATPNFIKKIILLEGLILSFTGAIAGMIAGTAICVLQKKYGFVKIAEGSTFVIKSYPVAFNGWDFVVVLLTVLILGFGASYYPSLSANKRINVGLLRSRQ